MYSRRLFTRSGNHCRLPEQVSFWLVEYAWRVSKECRLEWAEVLFSRTGENACSSRHDYIQQSLVRSPYSLKDFLQHRQDYLQQSLVKSPYLLTYFLQHRKPWDGQVAVLKDDPVTSLDSLDTNQGDKKARGVEFRLMTNGSTIESGKTNKA